MRKAIAFLFLLQVNILFSQEDSLMLVIDGLVINKHDSTAISGATVQLQYASGDTFELQTDSTGHFVFRMGSKWDFKIFVSKEGYLSDYGFEKRERPEVSTVVYHQYRLLPISKVLRGQISILEYGHSPSNDWLNARSTIADQWDIGFLSVAQCIVAPFILQESKAHNLKVKEELRAKYGDDWEARFNAEIDEELEFQRKARNLIDEQDYISELDSSLAEDGNGLYYFLTPQIPQKIYSVEVFGYGDWKGESEMLTYYILSVDIERDYVSVVSDEIKLLDF